MACAGDRVAVGIGDGQELAPRVIIILCNQCAGGVEIQCYYITLQITTIAVMRPIGIRSLELIMPS